MLTFWKPVNVALSLLCLSIIMQPSQEAALSVAHLFICHVPMIYFERHRNFKFSGDMTLKTSNWGQKIKDQGHWEWKCKSRFLHIIFRKSRVYVNPRPTDPQSIIHLSSNKDTSGNISLLKCLYAFWLSFFASSSKTDSYFSILLGTQMPVIVSISYYMIAKNWGLSLKLFR